MQKVVGSSPIIRSQKAPETGPVALPARDTEIAAGPLWKQFGNCTALLGERTGAAGGGAHLCSRRLVSRLNGPQRQARGTAWSGGHRCECCADRGEVSAGIADVLADVDERVVRVEDEQEPSDRAERDPGARHW
jgi:hypothetical protein